MTVGPLGPLLSSISSRSGFNFEIDQFSRRYPSLFLSLRSIETISSKIPSREIEKTTTVMRSSGGISNLRKNRSCGFEREINFRQKDRRVLLPPPTSFPPMINLSRKRVFILSYRATSWYISRTDQISRVSRGVSVIRVDAKSRNRRDGVDFFSDDEKYDSNIITRAAGVWICKCLRAGEPDLTRATSEKT